MSFAELRTPSSSRVGDTRPVGDALRYRGIIALARAFTFTGREWRTIETDATTWQACDTARSYALKTYERIHRERGHAVALDLEEAD